MQSFRVILINKYFSILIVFNRFKAYKIVYIIRVLLRQLHITEFSKRDYLIFLTSHEILNFEAL